MGCEGDCGTGTNKPSRQSAIHNSSAIDYHYAILLCECKPTVMPIHEVRPQSIHHHKDYPIKDRLRLLMTPYILLLYIIKGG